MSGEVVIIKCIAEDSTPAAARWRTESVSRCTTVGDLD